MQVDILLLLRRGKPTSGDEFVAENAFGWGGKKRIGVRPTRWHSSLFDVLLSYDCAG
jgi:hypothetical protein